MSTLRDAMSHAALGWVKPELDETLRQVRNEVEQFVEEPTDTSRMRFCAGYLHQVQGTLRMVELYAPAMVAEELELLANAVRDGAVLDRDEACATLMRGTVLLPDYLERLQNGHRDIPIVLLPLLNEIRAVRGAEGINESVLLAFNPDAGDATPAELEHARGSLQGHNRELLDTVGSAVKEDLMRIKDALDLHVRTGGNPADLQTQVNELRAVSDTLGMMGLGVARGIVAKQRDALSEVVAGSRTIDDSLLLDIAGSLLYVDASLDDQVAHLGANEDGAEDAASVETRRTVEVLAHEAIANFTAARESFVAFIETNWDHARLAEVPRLLDEVSGALRMLELPEPAEYLHAVSHYIQNELIARQRVPSGRQLDTLADAMASLEYYLEALRDRRSGREEILDITRSSLETLHYWPVPMAGVAAAAETAAPLRPVVADVPAPVAPVVEAPQWSVDAPAQEEVVSFDAPAAAQGDADVAATPEVSAFPPPLPLQEDIKPTASVEPALVFGAAILTKSASADVPQMPSVEGPLAGETTAPVEAPEAGLSFDPVAAEQPELEGSSYRVAPITLEERDDAPAEGIAPTEFTSFDPVVSEGEAEGIAPTQTYTFDSSLLELDSTPLHSAQIDAPSALDHVEHLPRADAFFEPTLEETAPLMADATPEAVEAEPTTDSWQLESTPLELQPQADQAADDAEAAPTLAVEATDETAPQLSDAAAEVTAHDAYAAADDAAATAFLAELDAAATSFDPSAASVAPAAVATLDGGFINSGDDIDQDIRDVFIEEFDEELVNLGHLLTAWRAAPGNLERLRPVRRVFHTLKGSGRLVGARTLGEFSWKIEGMLNRVLDGSRPASPAVVSMVNQAYEVLPELNAALRNNGRIHADLLGMQDVADRVGAGEEAFYLGAVAAAAPSVVEPVETASRHVEAETVSEAVQAPVMDATDGVPASVDSVLREILEAEIGNHLETVNSWLSRSRVQPQPVSEELLRAVHTMSGAFAMTDVPVITSITAPAESFVKRSLATSTVPGAAGVEALAQMALAVSTTIHALRADSPRIPAFPGVAERLQALGEALPDAKWPPQAADDEGMVLPMGGTVRPDLSGAEDLSAYFDTSMLEETPGGMETVPTPPAPVTPVETEQEASAPTVADVQPEEAAAVEETTSYADATPVDAQDSGSHFVAEEPQTYAAETQDAAGIDAEAPVETAASDDIVAPAAVEEEQAAPEGKSAFGWLAAAGAAVAGVAAAAFGKDKPAHEEARASEEADAGAVADEAASTPEASDEVEAHDEAVVEATTNVQDDALAADTTFEETEQAAQDVVEAAADEVEPEQTDVAADASVEDVAAVVEVEADEAKPVEVIEIEEAADQAAAFDALDEAAALPDYGQDASELPVTAVEEAVITVEADSANDEIEASIGVEAEEPAPVAESDVEVEVEEIAATESPVEADAQVESVELAAEDEPAQTDVEEATATVDEAVEAADVVEPIKVELAPLTAPLPVDQPVVAAEPVTSQLVSGPLDFNELDRELVDIFVEEGKDLLDHCDGLLSELRSTPEDREVLAGLQRDLHTLKGGARMAGINAIGDLGHSIESLLEAVAANRTEMTRGDVQLLERGFDRLHQLLVHTGEHHAVHMPLDLINALEARTDGRAVAEPALVESPLASTSSDTGAATDATTIAEEQPRQLVDSAPLSAPIIDEQTGDDEGGQRGQEQVRVRADLLDSLVNHAGEVAIYRSRLEQQLGAFRGAMAELDRTNARLRDQLRRLDLETEAQIVARYRREHEQADQTFDPLELDRFSTLQQLSRALNESAADLGGLQGVLDDLSRNYDNLLQQQSRVSSELQDGLMRARMVPFDGLVPRLRRVVRQAAQETGKQVHLKLEGTHGELDRNVLDRMVAPLEHMLRNSVAHGLELPAARTGAGKPEEGEIALRLRREGSEIVLEVADDGAGLDRAAIRRRAEQRGLLAAGDQIDDTQLDQMIFASGFSTSEQVSQLAGRGVGMDVVRNEVRQLGGSVDIHSERGHGATFTLRLPQTLAVTQAVFVRIGETTYAVPVASVSGIGRISRERFESGQGGYHYNGEDYTLYNMGTLVGQASAKAEGQSEIPLLLVRSGDLHAAVAIDQVLGNREIVVKPVGLQIASVPGIYGATITGEGNVVVILDVAPLVRRHLAQPQQAVEVSTVASQRHVPLVMVVDDSLTMRKVTGRVLERHNFEVATARDGVEALELLEERVPDLMLLDIEMPRMDGYELATAMRADPRYKAVPIVMITSRSGDKHRQRAFEIGVQRYLGKPYQELDLMRNVYDLLGIARARE